MACPPRLTSFGWFHAERGLSPFQSSYRASFITRKFLEDANFLQFPSSASSNPPFSKKFRLPAPNPQSLTNRKNPHFLVVGFSGRALAQAAYDAGLIVTVADQFGDADTLQVAVQHIQLDFASNLETSGVETLCEPLLPLFRLSDDKLGVVRPISGVLLGGGCENRPGLVAQLAELCGGANMLVNLLGLPQPTALVQLRDRDFWAAAAQSAGCKFPTSMSADSALLANRTATGQWLIKSNSSAGGLGVRRLTSPYSSSVAPPDVTIQKFIDGRQLGVTLVIEPNGTRILGCTESLGSQDWQTPSQPPMLGEFLYRGSWGPIQLSEQQTEQILKIGEYCRSKAGWLGWLQLDFIEDADQLLWLLEINPRWTAGMEVLWRSGTCNPVAEHLAALGKSNLADAGTHLEPRLCAKAVWYADRNITAKDLNVAAQLTRRELNEPDRNQSTEFTLCDIPTASNEIVSQGHPGLTIVVKQTVASDASHPLSQRRLFLSRLEHARRTLLSNL